MAQLVAEDLDKIIQMRHQVALDMAAKEKTIPNVFTKHLSEAERLEKRAEYFDKELEKLGQMPVTGSLQTQLIMLL